MTNQAAQTMPELKPCPFCGGEAERIDFGPGDAENAGGSCIACKRCQSSGPVEFGYKENFISNWNRRAAALSQTAGVPEGWKLVPVEPTEAMAKAGESAWPPINNACCPWPQPEDVYAAMLAAAPAASGGEVWTREMIADVHKRGEELFQRINPPAAAPVSERERLLLAAACDSVGLYETADGLRANLKGLDLLGIRSKLLAIEQALTQQRGEVEDEDYHVIMSMGRLLAEIAVTLKGAEPAGTAWSYHDLPELVKSAVENAHDIASEMRAWAAVKMRERGSSRRDKMMVEEWSKRLLALPEVAFPVKDFDIPGLSITKEEIRFAIRKVVADRAFIGQDFGGTTHQPSADAVRDGIRMDWLVSKAVEVRDPLRHGSRAMFHAQTASDEDEPHRTTLREQIDAAMADELESLLSGGSHA